MVCDEHMTVRGPQRLRCCCLAAARSTMSVLRADENMATLSAKQDQSSGQTVGYKHRACMCDGLLMPMLRSALTRGCDRPSATQSSDAKKSAAAAPPVLQAIRQLHVSGAAEVPPHAASGPNTLSTTCLA